MFYVYLDVYLTDFLHCSFTLHFTLCASVHFCNIIGLFVHFHIQLLFCAFDCQVTWGLRFRQQSWQTEMTFTTSPPGAVVSSMWLRRRTWNSWLTYLLTYLSVVGGLSWVHNWVGVVGRVGLGEEKWTHVHLLGYLTMWAPCKLDRWSFDLKMFIFVPN